MIIINSFTVYSKFVFAYENIIKYHIKLTLKPSVKIARKSYILAASISDLTAPILIVSLLFIFITYHLDRFFEGPL